MFNFVEVLHVTQWISLKCLKVALVGSYKGSCRLYNTSGMNSLSLSLSPHNILVLSYHCCLNSFVLLFRK